MILHFSSYVNPPYLLVSNPRVVLNDGHWGSVAVCSGPAHSGWPVASRPGGRLIVKRMKSVNDSILGHG